MFDLRYHVASLAAVFLALVVGILVGAAISDPELADRAEALKLRDDIADLERRLETAESRSEQDEAAQAFVGRAYDAVMHDRLDGIDVALVFVGSVDKSLGLEEAIEEDAGGRVLRMRAIDVGFDPAALQAALDRLPEAQRAPADGDIRAVGELLGEELVAGGETPFWDALTNELVQQRSGDLDDEADAIVVARTTVPLTLEAEEFVLGLLAGLRAQVPAVGVEASRARPSAASVYERARLSVVDNVNTRMGKVSLAVLLAGGDEGHYGLRDGADAVVPPIEPVTPIDQG